jgi:hypothetical protein
MEFVEKFVSFFYSASSVGWVYSPTVLVSIRHPVGEYTHPTLAFASFSLSLVLGGEGRGEGPGARCRNWQIDRNSTFRP